jgi:exoribonuclease-2
LNATPTSVDAQKHARATKEQSAHDDATRAMWRRLTDAIAAPPDAKPPPDAFARDGSLLELRVEALEAFALGDGLHSSGQKASAIDALDRCGMRRTWKSAFDLLVAIGRWRGYENLAIRRHGIPTAFPARVLDEADAVEAAAIAAADGDVDDDVDAATRKDLRGRFDVYAIDGDDTFEVDDGVSAEAMGPGSGDAIRVWIHVADVARHVRLGGALEAEARERGASGYAVRLLSIRPRSRGARRSLRTFPVVTLHPRFPFNV